MAMKLTRTAALAVLVHCGFKNSAKWDNTRVAEKLKSVGDVAPATPPADEATSKVLNEVLACIKEGKQGFEVEDDETSKSPAAPAVGEQAKGGTAAPAAPAAPTKPPAEKLTRLRASKTTAYTCGEVFKQLGVSEGVADAHIAKYNELRGKENNALAEANLVFAWHVIHGYNGEGSYKTITTPAPATSAESKQEESKKEEPAPAA